MSEGRFRVELAPAALRRLRRLTPGDARVRGPILALATSPRPPGAVKLSGAAFWRLRVGELRIVYTIVEADRFVLVLKVARRAESTYRRLK